MVDNEDLVRNLEAQLNRLVAQLKDLDEIRDELEKTEWEEMKQDTITQIEDFNETLARITSGNLSLESKVSQLKQCLRKAIADSFNTSDMIKKFDGQCVIDEEKEKPLDNLELEKKIQKTPSNENKMV